MLDISGDNFKKEVIGSKEPVLIDFWAPWCMPCKVIAPAVEELSEDLKGKVKVYKSNVDDNPDLATELSIFNIPTLLLFKDGKEVSRIIGINSKDAIAAKIKSVIE